MTDTTIDQFEGVSRADRQHRDYQLHLGMGMFLGTVTMLFGAFSSAYIVRGATSQDWQAVPLPSFLWWNTLAIIVSSVALEVARRAGGQDNWRRAGMWMGATLVLAMLFLGGQFAAWQWLWAAGIGVPTSPHASFFFILTGVHGLHLVAGLVVLSVAGLRLLSVDANDPASAHRAYLPMSLGAMLWHFLAALWVYLIIMLTLFA
ncbi:MAG: cytochrome-c oxidase [Acidobacteria bacterium]|nr:cytochrome-c oxidase [Acidobacteriota bacterium]